MNGDIQPFFDALHAMPNSTLLVGIALGLALLLAGVGGLMLIRHQRDPRTAARRVRAMLRASGLPHVRDVVIPDHVGGYTQVDHLVLTPEGIVLLEWQHFSGVIHGSAHTQRWIRFENKQRHDFDNPFRRLNELANTLAALAPDARVLVRLVASGPVRFAKAMPQGVLNLHGLAEYLAASNGPIASELRQSWHHLLSRVACDPVAPNGARLQTEGESHAPAAA